MTTQEQLERLFCGRVTYAAFTDGTQTIRLTYEDGHAVCIRSNKVGRVVCTYLPPLPGPDQPQTFLSRWRGSNGDVGLNFFGACLTRWQLPFLAGQRVLELGCAEADWMTPALAAEPGLRILGVDPRGGHDTDGATVVMGDAFALDEPDGAFDWVVGISSLEHFGLVKYGAPLVADGDTFIAERIWRWLKPGGHFYFDVPYDPRGYRLENGYRVYDDQTHADRFGWHRWIERGRLYQHPSAPGALIPKPVVSEAGEQTGPYGYYDLACWWSKP